MFALKLQWVYISAPVTKREVCPRLLPLLLTKIRKTKYNLLWNMPYMHRDKCSNPPLIGTPNQLIFRGSVIRPTQRSVAARQRNKSFEGGWSEVSFRRATSTRVFPRNATTERKLLNAMRYLRCPPIPLVKESEHRRCSNTPEYFSPSVKFPFSIRWVVSNKYNPNVTIKRKVLGFF